MCTKFARYILEVGLLCKSKVKQFHYRHGQALRVPGGWGSQITRQLPFEGGKFVSPMHRPPLTPRNIPGTHFCWRLSRPQGCSAAGRIMWMKKSNDTIGNRTRDLPARSAVPQPAAPPRAPVPVMYMMYLCASVYLGMSFAHSSHDLFTPVFIVNKFECTECTWIFSKTILGHNRFLRFNTILTFWTLLLPLCIHICRECVELLVIRTCL